KHDVSVRLVERIEPSIHVASEEHAARCRRHAGHDRAISLVPPANAAVRAIDRMDPPRCGFGLVGSVARPHVQLALDVFMRTRLERRTPVHRAHVDGSRCWIESRTIPLDAAEYPGAGANAFLRRFLVGV